MYSLDMSDRAPIQGRGSCYMTWFSPKNDRPGARPLRPGGWGALPYMGYIGMCRCEGYGFQAVYSRIGYINQGAWV